MHTVVLVLMLLVNLMVFAPVRPGPAPIVRDDEVILLYPVPYVDVYVLDNDGTGAQDDLTVVAAAGFRSSKAAVVQGTFVRVYIDWASYYAWPPNPNDEEFGDAVAHGVYTVSNGSGQASARWVIYYWPEMQI